MLFQKLPTRGPARKTRNPHVTVHRPGRRWPPSAQSNGVPGPEGSSVRDLGLGRHQQPRGGTEPAGALQGLGGLPWPWLRLAEVSQLWPSWWLGMEAEGGSQDWGSPSEQK